MSGSRTLLYVAILLIAVSAFAADPTADLLGAKHVDSFIRLKAGKFNKQVGDGTVKEETVVLGEVDTRIGAFHPIAGKTFASDGDISILIADFNPLTQAWTVKSTSSPDPNYGAIKLFLDDLKSLQAALPDVAEAEKLAAKKKEAADPCDDLRELIATANKSLNDSGLTADELKTIANGATGNAGVSKASTTLNEKRTKMLADNTAARKALDDIRKKFGRTEEGTKATSSCKAVSSEILVDYIYATGRAERIIAARAALAASIADLIKQSLEPFSKPEKWAAPTDLAFTSVEPTFENQFSVSASMKPRTVEIDDGNSISLAAGDAVSADFILRRDSFWVPERAAAVIYNRLTYPKYGTVKDGDVTRVKREEDTQPVGGAMMLNLIPRFSRTGPVHPMLQIGVSSAKDFPGFLAGIGLRFSQPTAFSISAGGMITRYKDLDKNLKEGAVVSGTSEIDAHLAYKTSPIVLYGAIQMKF